MLFEHQISEGSCDTEDWSKFSFASQE